MRYPFERICRCVSGRHKGEIGLTNFLHTDTTGFVAFYPNKSQEPVFIPTYCVEGLNKYELEKIDLKEKV